MNSGDFFWGDPTNRGIEHPWVLLSNPCRNGGYAVFLNFTDDRERNLPDAVPVGYHVSITKISTPSWGDMLVWTTARAEAALACSALRCTPPPLHAVKVMLLVEKAKNLGFVSREIKKLLA